MESIHKNLVLDHLYFSSNEDEFTELLQIFSPFKCASHQQVKSDGDQWEGLYIQTRGQNYLEILKDRRANGIGLCMKPFGVMSQNASLIKSDFPNLPWKSFERISNGKPWFTAYSCDNYLDLKTPFNTWVMQYHQRSTNTLIQLPKIEITRIEKIIFSANPDLLETIKNNSIWFNAESVISEEKAVFQIQTYYSDPFQLEIIFNKSTVGFNFKIAVLKMDTADQYPEKDFKKFIFKKEGSDYVLRKK